MAVLTRVQRACRRKFENHNEYLLCDSNMKAKCDDPHYLCSMQVGTVIEITRHENTQAYTIAREAKPLSRKRGACADRPAGSKGATGNARHPNFAFGSSFPTTYSGYSPSGPPFPGPTFLFDKYVSEELNQPLPSSATSNLDANANCCVPLQQLVLPTR